MGRLTERKTRAQLRRRSRDRTKPGLSSGFGIPFALLPILCVLTPEPSPAEPQWRSYLATESAFRVDAPASVVHDTSANGSIAGTVFMNRYAIRLPGARLDLERHEIPRLAPWILSASFVLDLARDRLLEDIDAKLISEQEIVRQGHPGRRLIMRRSSESSREETRIYLAGRYIYVIAAGPWWPELRETVVDRFFDSLRLCPANPTNCDPVESEFTEQPTSGSEVDHGV